ncbi:MAG: hypothetical protein P8X64_12320 [Anaerolineales bacterium]|jgi:hypothetical protein
MKDQTAPNWFTAGEAMAEPQRYSPREIDRYGERLAWSLGVALAALALFMYWRQGAWIASLIVISSLCLLAALLISYGNWMERSTRIEISRQGLLYHNPLRELNLPWDSIQAVSVSSRGDGWRVIVEGDAGVFSFQTQTSLKLGWGRQVDTGIVGGDRLVSMIVGKASLGPPQAERGGWTRRHSAGLAE